MNKGTGLLRPLFVAILVLFLNACSIFQQEVVHAPVQQPYNWDEIKTEIQKIRAWKLYGKVGIRTPNESVTAAVNQWLQVDDFFDIKLSSTFFGLGATNLSGNAEHVLLERAGEAPLHSNNPNTLIEEALGVPLPIAYMIDWIRALPEANGTFEREFNLQGLPAKLTQHGWEISYKRYVDVGDTPLPSKITLSNESSRIIIAIKEWQIEEQATPVSDQNDY